MTDDVTFGPPRNDDDRRRFARLSQYAFWDEPAADPDIGWLGDGGGTIIRLARRGERVIGGAIVTPAGQWFGGRPVPSALIGAVSVAPEQRFGGIGKRLVADYLRVARDAGLAISTLYPASFGLYHWAGYEHAGTNLRYELPAASLATMRLADTGIVIREHEGDDAPLRATHERQARLVPGQIQRPDRFWSDVLGEQRQATHRYVAERDGEIVGYLIFTQRTLPGAGRVLDIRDFVATSGPAARALLGFLATHWANVETIRFWGGANDHRLLALPHPALRPGAVDPWMIRILDLPAALTARGYSPGVTAEWGLDYHDDQLPENTGRWVVRIEGGNTTVEPGGDGRIVATARGLSGLFSGAYAAETIADPTHLVASGADLASLGLAFAEPAPWMADHF